MLHLLKVLLISSLISVSLGCSDSGPQEGLSSSVEATDLTRQMVGQWGSDGEVTLIIELIGDTVVFSAPENDTWRMDVLDARIVDQEVHFIQKNFLHDGSSHPFNGVACETTVKLLDDDTLQLAMTTDSSPDLESEVLSRIP
ncbi:MAG: hypothetical protein AAGG48_29355 [Planctomycetota bacterium]